MAVRSVSEFIEHIAETLGDFGSVQIKRMFGGHGVFRDGLMFALVADDELFLKADAQTVADFEALGLDPFTYQRAGKRAQLSYYRAPESFLEDRELAHEWAKKAFDAALRARKSAKKSRSPKGARSS